MMTAYLSPVDWLLLGAEWMLAIAVWWELRRPGIRLPVLRWWMAALAWLWLPALAWLAGTATAERYGDWYVRGSLIEGVLVAAVAVELAGKILPWHARAIWRWAPGVIAVTAICAGVMIQRTWWEEIAAGTMIAGGGGLVILLSALFVSEVQSGESLRQQEDRDRETAGRMRPIAWAFALWLAGQIAAMMLPGWLDCSEPGCLTGGSWTAGVVRQTAPVVWTTGAIGILWTVRKVSARLRASRP